MGSPYNKRTVDDWLSRINTERALVVWTAIVNGSGQADPLMTRFRRMSPWEQLNCLYGLKDMAEAHMASIIADHTRQARDADDLLDVELQKILKQKY